MTSSFAFMEAITAAVAECRTSVESLDSKLSKGRAQDGTSTPMNSVPAFLQFSEQVKDVEDGLEFGQLIKTVQRKLGLVDSALIQVRVEVEKLQKSADDTKQAETDRAQFIAEHNSQVEVLEKELENSMQQITELSESIWLQVEHDQMIQQLQAQRALSQQLEEAILRNAKELMMMKDKEHTLAVENDIFRKHLGEDKSKEILSSASAALGAREAGRSVATAGGAAQPAVAETEERDPTVTFLQALNRSLQQRDKELEMEREKGKSFRSQLQQNNMDSAARISDLQQNLISAKKDWAKYFELYRGVQEELNVARDRHEVDARCMGHLWAINEKLKNESCAMEDKVWTERQLRELMSVRVTELEEIIGKDVELTQSRENSLSPNKNGSRNGEHGLTRHETLKEDAESSPSTSKNALQEPIAGGHTAKTNGMLLPAGGRERKRTSPRTQQSMEKTLAGYHEMLTSRDVKVIELQKQLKASTDARQAEQEAVVQHLKCEDDDKRQLRSELNHERIVRSKAERESQALQFELRTLQQQLAVRHAMAFNPSPSSPQRSSTAGGSEPPASPSSSHSSSTPAQAAPSPGESLFSGLIGFLSPSPRSSDTRHNPLPTATITSPRGQPSSPASPSKNKRAYMYQPMSPAGMGGGSPNAPMVPLETIAEREREDASPRDADSPPVGSPRTTLGQQQEQRTIIGNGSPSDQGSVQGGVIGGKQEQMTFNAAAAAQRAGYGDPRSPEYGDPRSPEWRITL